MGLSGFCFLSLHPNYLFCYCHYNPERSLLNRFIPYFWSLDDFACVCCFKLQDLVNLFEVRLACKKPCRIGLVMCFSGSDCCEKPCTGMHNNQLIGSSCCHQQKCTTNTIFSLFHPLQSSFSFLNQNQVSKMSLKKKSLPWPCLSYSRNKKKGRDQHRMPVSGQESEEWNQYGCFPQ